MLLATQMLWEFEMATIQVGTAGSSLSSQSGSLFETLSLVGYSFTSTPTGGRYNSLVGPINNPSGGLSFEYIVGPSGLITSISFITAAPMGVRTGFTVLA